MLEVLTLRKRIRAEQDPATPASEPVQRLASGLRAQRSVPERNRFTAGAQVAARRFNRLGELREYKNLLMRVELGDLVQRPNLLPRLSALRNLSQRMPLFGTGDQRERRDRCPRRAGQPSLHGSGAAERLVMWRSGFFILTD